MERTLLILMIIDCSLRPAISNIITTLPEEKAPDDEKVQNSSLSRTITIQYNGHSYVMVLNKKLSFPEAQQFCRQEFSKPLNLVSISNAKEWNTISDKFGHENNTNIWLGGEVKRHHAGPYFGLTWLDQTQFSYQRIPRTEQNKWLEHLSDGKIGCLVGELKRDGGGDWTTRYSPCDEKLAFVCKGLSHSHLSGLHSQILPSFLTLPTKQLINQMSRLGYLDPYSLQELKNKAARERSIMFEERVFSGTPNKIKTKESSNKKNNDKEMTSSAFTPEEQTHQPSETHTIGNNQKVTTSFEEFQVDTTTEVPDWTTDSEVSEPSKSLSLPSLLITEQTKNGDKLEPDLKSIINEAAPHQVQIPSVDDSISFDDFFGFDEPSDTIMNWF